MFPPRTLLWKAVRGRLQTTTSSGLRIDDYNTVGAQGAHKEHTTCQQGIILQDREHATYKEHQGAGGLPGVARPRANGFGVDFECTTQLLFDSR